MVKYIFLDLDDTILDFKKAEAAAISKTLSFMGVEPTEKIISRYSEINDMMWKMLERKERTRAQILTERFAILYSELGVDIDADRTWTVYERFLSQGHWFIDGAPELLEALYKDYLLYLVSNGTASVQKGRLESSGIEKYFKGIFISQNIGINKPDKRFFDKVFETIDGFEKDKAIIIGDSITSDILGGINAGIKTLWFNPKNKCADITADFVVSKLSEIPEIIKIC